MDLPIELLEAKINKLLNYMNSVYEEKEQLKKELSEKEKLIEEYKTKYEEAIYSQELLKEKIEKMLNNLDDLERKLIPAEEEAKEVYDTETEASYQASNPTQIEELNSEEEITISKVQEGESDESTDEEFQQKKEEEHNDENPDALKLEIDW